MRLKKNALALVLCQIRWPALRHLRDSDALEIKSKELDPFLGDYPLVRKGEEIALNITAEGVVPGGGATMLEWLSSDETWIATLSTHSFSLACNRDYVDFAEFEERLRPLLKAVLAVLDLPRLDRIGVRYVNRFAGPEVLEHLPELFRGYGQPLSGVDDSVVIAASLQQHLYQVADMGLFVRAGHVGPGQTVDPAVASVDEPTWVLDLDAFKEGGQPADLEATMATVGKLADTSYDYFRHAITQEFLHRFGGQS